ncbi:c-type cytochrome [Ignatzschineria cameli]|uniref:Cytochrome c4 n=1 Tax=Ignatzschineria cameli TaxID=2182793 RepID=A0ABX5L5J7_9GAMM|nr:c-type cytochrome [Ignatzschineria cameli]PWD86477.1 cytochrome c4 [Ignatzschineria cameli]PWD92142.1 cytochrome c4 [Ignatzschineria cameli]PWD93273.1 cytochrome c4 [Ignatzschineria cameli]PWD94015.1 cytochrome c4 [Ignatzschineria cameli]
MKLIKKMTYLSLFSLLPFVSNADEGEKIYMKGGENPMAIACMTCHGMNGEGLAAAGYPSVAGKSAIYLAKQVNDFKEGNRTHPVMDGVAKALSEDEITEVALYMQNLPAPNVPNIPRSTQPTDLGSQLALRGDWSRNIPECIACHGPAGVGVGDAFPKLAGQSQLYIINQMNAWKNGTRKNDENDLMGHIARSLNDEEIQAVATYFSNLGTVGK